MINEERRELPFACWDESSGFEERLYIGIGRDDSRVRVFVWTVRSKLTRSWLLLLAGNPCRVLPPTRPDLPTADIAFLSMVG